MNIKEIKQQYCKKIDLLDLELIISRVIKKPREFVLAYPEHKLNKSQNAKCKTQILRRIKGEPLAYISGKKEFYGLNFKVNKNTLIPRPETELLVDETINIITKPNPSAETSGDKQKSKKTIIVDVGVGSGCIIISLAKNLIKSKLPITNYQFLATDISKPALRVAKQNAQTHKVNKKIKFFYGDLLGPVIKNKKLKIENCKLIIVSNLPYLTPSQIKGSPSIQCEPRIALNAGKDGLKYYRQLFKQIKKLKSLRVPCYALCEIDPKQAAKLKKIIKKNFPKAKIHPVKSPRGTHSVFHGVKIKKDLRGLDRLIVVKIS